MAWTGQYPFGFSCPYGPGCGTQVKCAPLLIMDWPLSQGFGPVDTLEKIWASGSRLKANRIRTTTATSAMKRIVEAIMGVMLTPRQRLRSVRIPRTRRSG